MDDRRRADWTTRNPERAIPHLSLPPLAALGGEPLLAGQRRLAALFGARIVAGLVLLLLTLDRRWWLLVPPAVAVLYGSTLTLVHHLIHGPLGLSSRARHLLLALSAALVGESGHALEATHLAHHGIAPDPTFGPGSPPAPDSADPEGWIEGLTAPRFLLAAPCFRYRLLGWGLRHAEPGRRRLVTGEAVAVAALHFAALAALPLTWLPAAYLASVAIGAVGFALVAGRGPQTNWGRPVPSPLVRVRAGRVSAALFLSHDLHLEHHAYPEVPMPRLRALTGAIGPHLERLPVLDVRLP